MKTAKCSCGPTIAEDPSCAVHHPYAHKLQTQLDQARAKLAEAKQESSMQRACKHITDVSARWPKYVIVTMDPVFGTIDYARPASEGGCDGNETIYQLVLRARTSKRRKRRTKKP